MVTAATSKQRQATTAGPDRLSSVLFVLAAFLAVLALLAWQLKLGAGATTRSVVLMRRVYATRIIETVRGPARGVPAVTQSTSSSGSATPMPPAPPTTSSSGAGVP
jgi:hypothetical protein